MKPTVIVGCGKSKHTRPLPAASMYRGLFIRHAVGWAKSVDARLLILSAKYGLITGEKIIAPYSATFSKAQGFAAENTAQEPTVPIPTITHQVQALKLSGTILMLAGASYEQVLHEAAPHLTIRRPFFDLAQQRFGDARNGYQTKLIREHWGKLPKV